MLGTGCAVLCHAQSFSLMSTQNDTLIFSLTSLRAVSYPEGSSDWGYTTKIPHLQTALNHITMSQNHAITMANMQN